MAPEQSDMEKVQGMWQDPKISERYARSERATRLFARVIVEKSGLSAVDRDVVILDMATGTGAVVQELYDAVPKEQWGKLKVVGGDISQPMLDYLKIRGEKAGWTNLETKLLDGNNLDLPESTYTHIFVCFAIFAMPKALKKLIKALKPGGFIAISTWSSLPWHPPLARAISKMRSSPYNPSIKEIQDKLFSGIDWGSESFISSHLAEAGLHNVNTVVEKHQAEIGNPTDYLESLQFPLRIFKGWWEEDKADELLEELTPLLYQELVDLAGGEDEELAMEFEGIVGWGTKPE